ncbi:hypothetical protein J2741_000359 [Methanolinea mesophila]|uniref:hypothetical protein n=1 Tax=Methanolinea mesophila TaxID=547055 RepID=UPI001AE76A25|nr:hypothetical protein [Methanolinea mesophila]MBP1927812.1 hypothetical protein [Methanolinea mesophila]
MKKLVIIFLACAFLPGLSLADHGIPAVPETQGFEISTAVYTIGNFASDSELQWSITDDPEGLPGVPPLAILNASIYTSSYTEHTLSGGEGLVYYQKELDVDTIGQVDGQYNVRADKQLAFVGIDGARVTSEDSILVDGASNRYLADEVMICPFTADAIVVIPSYCNIAQAGSLIDMSVANVRTTSTDRFVTTSGDIPVELNHDISVTEFTAGVPSLGTASAGIGVSIQEGRGRFMTFDGGNIILLFPDDLAEHLEYSEDTTATGEITSFRKQMHYESAL